MKPPFDISGDLDTPVSAFLKLQAFRPAFLLESVEGGERVGRYSFIGFGDAAFELRLDAQGQWFGKDRLEVPADQAALLSMLRQALARAPRPTAPGAGPGFPLAGGLVGYSSYDVVRWFERLPSRLATPSPVPDMHYVAPSSLLVFDHLTRGIALLHSGSEAERKSLRREVIAALRGAVPPSRAGAGFSPATASMSAAEFLQGVARTKEYIAAGDVYQLVLSVRFAGRHSIDPFDAYRALRLINPSPYMYYLALGDMTVVGSSPEALVKLSGGIAQLRPIAGTRPRAADDAEDRRREQELLADIKENAEHVMLVDLARNDLGRVARAGSVHVHPFRSIERYSHVMHIVSGVRGELAAGRDAFDLFAAAFPAGTLVGAPKVRAMEIIDELEPVGRSLYGGTVGYFGAQGEMDQAITIRTLVFRGDEYSYQAGAGIVADSIPQSEYEEVLAKSASAARALQMAGEVA
ncbi:MAG: anthranilate synthase component I family protein [Gammaproteobacteria bacterium]|nr:anthranilate synthase component I family protein [Gammaproteobacteria bacterium]MBM4229909.1 anthranilate synthase component I family protein [Gammaproteobacteria bacterium]